MNLEIGHRIATLRLQKGVSARDMSLSLGQNENYINHIENGKNFPSLQNLFYICEYLGITPAEFFQMENKNPVQMPQIVKQLQQLDADDFALAEQFIKRLCEK